MNLASKSDRMINFIIDSLIISIISIVIILIIGIFFGDLFAFEPYNRLVLILVHFLYYSIFEYKYGVTYGKLVTNTLVMRKDNVPLKMKNIIFRSIFRLTRLDILSYLFGWEIGMHDFFSKTIVIKRDSEHATHYLYV